MQSRKQKTTASHGPMIPYKNRLGIFRVWFLASSHGSSTPAMLLSHRHAWHTPSQSCVDVIDVADNRGQSHSKIFVHRN